jgi:hypothetical protein
VAVRLRAAHAPIGARICVCWYAFLKQDCISESDHFFFLVLFVHSSVSCPLVLTGRVFCRCSWYFVDIVSRVNAIYKGA